MHRLREFWIRPGQYQDPDAYIFAHPSRGTFTPVKDQSTLRYLLDTLSDMTPQNGRSKSLGRLQLNNNEWEVGVVVSRVVPVVPQVVVVQPQLPPTSPRPGGSGARSAKGKSPVI